MFHSFQTIECILKGILLSNVPIFKRVLKIPTVCRCRTLEDRSRNLTFFRPANANESTVLMGLSLITIISMFSDPANAYPDTVWILKGFLCFSECARSDFSEQKDKPIFQRGVFSWHVVNKPQFESSDIIVLFWQSREVGKV